MRSNGTYTIKQVNALLDSFKSEMESKISETKLDTLKEIYRVGSYYLSDKSTSPASVLGFGTWSAIDSGTVLMCATSSGGDNKFTVKNENIEQFTGSGKHTHGIISDNSYGNQCNGVPWDNANWMGGGRQATYTPSTYYSNFNNGKSILSEESANVTIGKTGTDLKSIDLTNKLKHPKLYAWIRTA